MDDYMKNIAKKIISEEVDKRILDIKNKIFLPQVDKIYHLACIASPEKYKKYSIYGLDINKKSRR